MKVAIVGSTGYIASFLLRKFEKCPNIDKILKISQSDNADVKLNLQQACEFPYGVLDEIDYVIFTAAISGPDKCASDFDLCWNINVIGTSLFIEEALKRNCKVLFFSSDAVYGDIPGQIYDEESMTEPQTPYGKMKKNIEDRFKNNKNFKAIRLSYVASAKDKFISYCLSCIEKSVMAEIFHPFYRNCIVVSDVVEVVYWMINHWNDYPYFVLNVAGNELVSRVRIADELNRFFNNRLKYTIVQPNESFYKNRPQITQMKSLYLNKYQIIESSTFTEKINKELEEIKL
jgi:dTDP-4-dehydrorhamnose reductase